jgi:prepilin-type N-terminal cleavage/methylation domain-containing protein
MKAKRQNAYDHGAISRFSRCNSRASEGAGTWLAGCSCPDRTMRPSGRTLPNDRASASAGFTLVELMITVAIIGVLALLATVGYSRWIRTAKTAEATAMLGAIKSAEETWRAEHLNYKDVSGSLETYYPLVMPPSDKKVAWNPATCAGTAVCDGFRFLNVQAESAVYYRYAVQAGPADGAPKTFDGKTFSTNAYDPWFVAKAYGDLDANGIPSYFWTSSFSTTILSEKPGE